MHDLDTALAAQGLRCLATLSCAHLPARVRALLDHQLCADTHSLAIIGAVGAEPWPIFARARALWAHHPDPLDHWTKTVLTPIAQAAGAQVRYVFDGPPWVPIQALAIASGQFHASPLGLTIHPQYGLWHAFRAVLFFPQALKEIPEASSSPCEHCPQPCLQGCPVRAFSGHHYDLDACVTHLGAPQSQCMQTGCAARLACPVGRPYHYASTQTHFHMQAFSRNHQKNE